jgi:hypothetical protein
LLCKNLHSVGDSGEDLLKIFLNDPVGFEMLFNYTRSEWSVENMLLYEDIQDLRKLKEPQKLRQHMQEMVQCYLSSNSVLEVNIPDTLRRNLITKLQLGNEVWSDEQIDALETAVLQNIADTFMRFKDTVQFKVYTSTKFNFKFRVSVALRVSRSVK